MREYLETVSDVIKNKRANIAYPDGYHCSYQDLSGCDCAESELDFLKYGKTTLQEFLDNPVLNKCNCFDVDQAGEADAVCFLGFKVDGTDIDIHFKNGVATSQN